MEQEEAKGRKQTHCHGTDREFIVRYEANLLLCLSAAVHWPAIKTLAKVINSQWECEKNEASMPTFFPLSWNFPNERWRCWGRTRVREIELNYMRMKIIFFDCFLVQWLLSIDFPTIECVWVVATWRNSRDLFDIQSLHWQQATLIKKNASKREKKPEIKSTQLRKSERFCDASPSLFSLLTMSMIRPPPGSPHRTQTHSSIIECG